MYILDPIMKENNEYLNSSKIIFYSLKMIGVFPFISFQKDKKKKTFRHHFLTFISLTLYSIAFINEVQFIYKTVIPLLRKFNYHYFVKVFPTTYTRLYFVFMPIISWTKCRNVQTYWDNWMRYQRNLEMITRTSYQCPIKMKLRWVSFVGILITVLITSNTKFESIYYVIIRTGISSVGYCMVLLEMMPILWYVNCKYIESVAITIICLVQKSILIGSEKNVQYLTNLWVNLCDLNSQFNRSHSTMYLGYLLLLMLSLINTFYYAIYLYVVEHNRAVGLTYLLPSLFCITNILILYESANSASRQITSQTEKLLLNCNMINLNGKTLRSITYFLEVIETKNPKFNFGGIINLNRSKIISLYAMVVNYLIVLKQFATT